MMTDQMDPQAVAINDAYVAFADAVQEIVNPDWLAEGINNQDLQPEAMGQLLMWHLAADGELDRKYWLAVAEHMGPDFIGAMRRAADFMDKVSEFG